MKSAIVFAATIFVSLPALASQNTLLCQYKAEPKSSISVGVDETYQDTETVLLGINAGMGNGSIQSALLRTGTLAKQIRSGSVVIAFAEDADSSAVEVFGANLLAVTRQSSGVFEGYISVSDDGIAAMAVTCQAK